MSVERIQETRPYPNFRLADLPEGERKSADSIRMNIGELHGRASSFWAARLLFQNCGERRVIEPHNDVTYEQWQLCAARDGVMSIYHYGRLLQGLDESLALCPNLKETIDIEGKKAARKRFERLFPCYISLRHAIAHSTERSKTVKDTRRHGPIKAKRIPITPEFGIWLGDDAESLLVMDFVYGTTFTSMWEGELVRCEINEEAGRWLDEITDAMWLAFDAIIDPVPEPPPTVTWSTQPPPGMG